METADVATNFCKRAGIDFPIVAFSHCRDVVAAVSRAGGLGVLGAAKFTPEELEIELSWLDKNLPGRPYGVDVLAPPPGDDQTDSFDLALLRQRISSEHQDFVDRIARKYDVPPASPGATPTEFSGIVVNRRDLEAHIEISLRHPIRLLVSGLGPFTPDVVERARSIGALVGGMCGSPTHAKRHVDAGADVIIAQGTEAGGHTGEISTLVLVPQVVDAVAPVPVLAAGGIATGRQLTAVLALGAQGAWMGSAWLASEESDVDPQVIEKLLAAESQQTLRTKCMTGKPVRMLRTSFEEEWEAPDAPAMLKAPLQGLLVQPLLKRIFKGRVLPLMGQPVGQAVGLIRERRTSRAIVEEMMLELVDTVERVRQELDLVE
jgi:NAD(P)H-dependent flavin oxidoreductase YrpB (nitropropane dioxygenase family)